MNRHEAMQSPEVHNLTKHILSICESHDPVDRVYDIQLALDIVTAELDELLGTFEKDTTIKPAGSGEPSMAELEDNSAVCQKYMGDCDACSQDRHTC